MRKRANGLHLDRVHLLNGVVEDTRRVNDLPFVVQLVTVAQEQRLGREWLVLHVDVGTCYRIHETGLAHVGLPDDEQRAVLGIDCWQTAHVLSNLF